jgi:hypothetical protein
MNAIKQCILLFIWGLTTAVFAQNAGPYEVDSYTLHLYHFDGDATDAVTVNAVDLTLNNATVSAASYSDFGMALDTYTGGDSAIAYSDEKLIGTYFTGTDGAFTFEAIVKPLVAITAIPNHMEIISGDDEDADRGWQFRITTAGQLEFNNISAGGNQFLAPLPPYTVGSWYHAAVTYNGQAGAADNLKLYWTKLDDSPEQAAELASFQMSADINPSYAIDFAVGNEARGTSSENFEGLIDEVRISSIARQPNDMIFAFSAVPRPVIITHPVDAKVSEPHTAVFQTVFESQSTPVVQWFKTDPAGDIELTIANPDIDIQTACDPDTQQYVTTLSIRNTSLAEDTGGYYCRVNNDSTLPRNSNTVYLTVVGLVAHWTMDLSDFVSGYYVDRIAGYPAAAAGTPIFVAGADGQTVKAVHITPTTGWASLDGFTPSSTGALTVSLWVNWQEPVGTTGDLAITGNFVPESSVAMPNGLKADGQWQHICMVFDGATCQLYSDGLLQAEGAFALPTEMTALLEIGSTDGGDEPFNGSIDELGIYNYAMNDMEVAELRYAFTGLRSCIFAYGDRFDWTGPEGISDCRVDIYDLVDFAVHYLSSDGNYDLSGPLALPDGIVNLYDFTEMASLWMDCGLYPDCP